jgi:hypothetical protein
MFNVGCSFVQCSGIPFFPIFHPSAPDSPSAHRLENLCHVSAAPLCGFVPLCETYATTLSRIVTWDWVSVIAGGLSSMGVGLSFIAGSPSLPIKAVGHMMTSVSSGRGWLTRLKDGRFPIKEGRTFTAERLSFFWEAVFLTQVEVLFVATAAIAAAKFMMAAAGLMSAGALLFNCDCILINVECS